MSEPIDAPTLALRIDDLVDWLELSAMFNEFGVARVDGLIGSLLEQEETSEDDIGERERQKEALIESIENEVRLRTQALEDSYPFALSDTAEELQLSDGDPDKQVFYFVCLIATHVTGSPILNKPPVDDQLVALRNDVFQIVATLGLGGLAIGPAFSVGWPRRSGEAIVDLLDRAAAAGGGFTVRNPPGQYVSPKEKDGGVDAIAFKAEGTPPPTAFYFGQTASGKNWPGKSVSDHAAVFHAAYMQDHMTGNLNYVTLIPYRVLDDRFWHAQHQLHRSILDRLRLPLRALQGALLAQDGMEIDGGDKVGELKDWVEGYLGYAKAA